MNSNATGTGTGTNTNAQHTLIAFLPQKCGQLFSQRENAKKSQND